ncbi:GTP-binding protein [Candidatus Microgenomates bacterium]|nr:MAG: GTP-binding protein [Candidatus Microgenomates bacterium]
MATVDEQIKDIEKEIRETPYHKGTEHHIGKLRARLSRLKDRALESQARKGGGGGGYAVKKQGDATVVLVGPPSAGKSTLLNALTNAESKVAPYAFTTVSVIPGMMKYNEAYIQILDVPGLIEGAEEGKGRGREVLSVVRGADLLVLITDVKRPEAHARIADALERNGIRLNKRPPQVRVERKLSGGLTVKTNIHQNISKETIKEVAGEMGIKNAEISITESLNMDTLIDAFARNRVYIPTLFVFNKSDLYKGEKQPGNIYLSADKQEGLESFRQSVWNYLGFVTIYLVRAEEKPGTNNPMIMKRGDTLRHVADKIGSEFARDKTKARIWGEGAKFPGQEVSLRTLAKDNMQIRFV